MSDEVHFHRSGYEHQQNLRYQADRSPIYLHQGPLRSAKATVTKVKLFHYRPFGLQEAEGRRTFWTDTRKWQGCKPYTLSTFTQGDLPGKGKGKFKAMPLQALQTPGG